MDLVDLGPAAQQLAVLVARVPDAQLGNPAPCPAHSFLVQFASPDLPAGPELPFGGIPGGSRRRIPAGPGARPGRAEPAWPAG
jgi:hypothetical protein